MVANLALLVLEILLLSGVVLALHRLSPRYGLTPLIAFTIGLTVFVQAANMTLVYIQLSPDFYMVIAATICVPIILLAVLILYVVEGTVPARLTIFSILGVNILYLLLFLSGRLHLSLAGGGSFMGLTPDSPFMSPDLTIALASWVAFAADLFIIAVIYQGIKNHAPRLPAWIAPGLALMISLWSDTILYQVLANGVAPDFFATIADDLLGKTIVGLILWPLAALYLIRVAPGLLRFRGVESRPTFDLWFGSSSGMEASLARSQAALRESEEKFRSIFEQSSDSIVLCNEEGRIIAWNQAAEQMTGLTGAETLGQYFYDIQFKLLPEAQATPAAYERTRSMMEEALHTGQAPWLGRLLEGEIRGPAGQRHYFQQVASPIRTTRGYMISNITRDITERKRTEEELRASQARLQAIFDNVAVGIATTGLDGHYIQVNDAWQRMFGYRREEIDQLTYLDTTSPGYLEESHRQFESLAHGEVSAYRYEKELVRKDRSTFWGDVSVKPIYNLQGQIEATIAVITDVTERKRAEAAVWATEALYQSLVEILPMSVCRKDLDGRFTFVNQRYCDEFKLPASEIIGKIDYDLHPAELAEKYRQDDRDVVAGGQTVEMIEEHEPLGGERIYVQVFKSPIYDASGRPNGVQIVFWDVSERKRAEQQIRQQAARAQALAELSQLLTEVSQGYQQVLEAVVRRCAELIGDGASIFLYEPDRPQLELVAVYNPNPEAVQIFREHMRANPIGVDEGAYGHVLKTGQSVLVPIVSLEKLIAEATPERRAYYQKLPLYSAMFAPLRAHGEILGVLGLGRHTPGKSYSPEDMTFLQDIADRSALTIVNAQLYADARERTAQLTVMNEIGQAVSTLQDLDSMLRLIYRQVQRIASVDAFYIGLYDAETEQVSFPIFYDMEVRYNQPTIELKPDTWIAQVIQTKEPFLLLRTPKELQEPDVRTMGSMRRSASILMIPLWRGERVVGILSAQSYTLNAYTRRHAEILTGVGIQVAIAIENAQLFTASQQELAERKRAQAEREQLIAELEAKNAELERFTYTVSHDLKSPLVTIRGFLGFLEKDAASGDQAHFKADMNRIVEATDKMQRLLTELLELSRVGRMMNPPQAVPFEDIVREALALARGRIEAHRVQVRIELDLPVVYGDHVRLVEAVQNLIDNACKFMGDQAEPRITIGVRGTDRDGKPIVCVQDNGIGIEPQYREKVFGLFDKLDPKSEGTGIGLALVRRIIEVHGGKIWVESDGLGTGSTFCFTLANEA